MTRIILITEYFNPPYDEGIKKTVLNLYRYLEKNSDIKVICRYGFEHKNIYVVKTNPLFYSKNVKKIIKNVDPHFIFYMPFQSSTFASYLRLKVISYFIKKGKLIFISLQPKLLTKWQWKFVEIIKPQICITPSITLKKLWDRHMINSILTPLPVNLKVFKDISAEDKLGLREKYKLPLNKFIIIHMGHFNEGRNLLSLLPMQTADNQVVVVGSSSTPKDAMGRGIIQEILKKNGVIVIEGFIEKIEELYQLSDLYIFPVIEENSSIGMPLSILEARACGLPVLTTNYGSVKYFLGNDNEGIIYSDPHLFLNSVNYIKKRLFFDYSNSDVQFLNETFFKIISEQIKL